VLPPYTLFAVFVQSVISNLCRLPDQSKASESLTGTMDEYNEAEDSHFFVFFFIATFICIVFYLIYQNKRKVSKLVAFKFSLSGVGSNANNRTKAVLENVPHPALKENNASFYCGSSRLRDPASKSHA